MPASCCSRRAKPLVAAGNGSYSDAERPAIAERAGGHPRPAAGGRQPRRRRRRLPVRRPGLGQPPFVDGLGGVSFRGTAGECQVASDEPLPRTVDGDARLAGARPRATACSRRARGRHAQRQRQLDRRRPRRRPAGLLRRHVAAAVADPAALAYRVSFATTAAGTTYTVLQGRRRHGADQRAVCQRPGDRDRRHGVHRARHAGGRRRLRAVAGDAFAQRLRHVRPRHRRVEDAAAQRRGGDAGRAARAGRPRRLDGRAAVAAQPRRRGT